MLALRRYGETPYTVAVVHGGPGAEMAPVARRVALTHGVREPIQMAHSVEGQIEELRTVVEKDCDRPIALVGYSWGAWLTLLVAVRYPALVSQLVLISSSPFEAIRTNL